jgi:hypothetical protein
MNVDHIVAVYKFTEADKQELINILAKGHLLAKAQAYQRAQSKTSHLVRLRKPWQATEAEVEKSQQWATQQVESIANTYETLLRHELERLPQERALGDIIGGIKNVVSAIGDWISGFLPWKTQQIADNTWSTGDNDGTDQFVDDVRDGDNAEELEDDGLLRLQILVEPGHSSSDTCASYAGNTYNLSDAVPNFPMHTNCIHYKTIVVNDQPIRRSVRANQDITYLFLDVDGVFSVASAGLPQETIYGKEAWPVPQANAILQAIDKDKTVRPIWMTHWGQLANGWCERAGLHDWAIWYPLTLEEDETEAERLYPDLGKKPQAIQYCMHVNNVQSAVWLQDGFSPEEREWAEQAGVRLVNANEEPIHSLLLSKEESAVQRLMDLLAGSIMRV